MSDISVKKQASLRPTRRDWYLMFRLPVLAATAWLVPARWWYHFKRRKDAGADPTGVRRAFPSRKERRSTGESLYLAEMVTYFREFRPGGWKPKISVKNLDILAGALAGGRGAVLWVANFDYANLVSKKALWDAGYRCHHLSRPDHGPSSSPFGRRFLNWCVQGAEARFLAERIVLSDEGDVAGLRRLRKVLSEGGIVSITAGSSGRQTRTFTCRGVEYVLATGAASLAQSARAPLFAVFTLQTNPDWQSFDVVIEGPLTVVEGADRNEAVASLMQDFVDRHERYLDEYGSYLHWYHHSRSNPDLAFSEGKPADRPITAKV